MTPVQRYLTSLQIVPLVAGGDSAPAWSPSGDRLVVLDHRPGRGLVLWTLSGEGDVVMSAAPLAELLAVPPQALVAAQLSWASEVQVVVDLGPTRVLVDVTTRAATVDERWAPARLVRRHLLMGQPPVLELASADGRWFATERERGIWLRTPDEDLRCLAKGEHDQRWDLEQSCWSPDSQWLLALRHDDTGVPLLPMVDSSGVHEVVTEHPYPRSGDPFPHTTAHLLGVDGEVVDIELGCREVFWLQPVGWADGELFLLVSPRDNRSLVLLSVNPSSGMTRVVVEERQETFVYGINLPHIRSSAFLLEDGLVWMSERDGYRHAYRYSFAGSLLARLTDGPFEVDRVVGLTSDGDVLLLARSDVANPYDVHLCSVGLDGTGFRQVTQERGQHQAWLSPDGTHVVVGHSSLDRLPAADLRTATGSLIGRINEAYDGLAPLVERPATEEITLDLGDGVMRHGVVITPPGFDPSREWPLVEVVYGGPQETSHPRDYRHLPNVLAQALAQLGIVTVVLDGTGTPGRGKAFQDAVHRRFGPHQSEEHGRMLSQLLDRLPYVDRSRVGVVGGSWGGYATLRLMLDRPDLYRVGAALYGVADLYDHNARPSESYMGTPAENPAGYADADLLGRMGSLTPTPPSRPATRPWPP